MRHSKITDLIWCGGELKPGDWEALYDRGVRYNLSLQEEARDHFDGLLPEAELWLPTRDWHMPTLEQLELAIRFIAEAVAADKGVLVHCKWGIGRAPMTVACYLITQGMSAIQAIQTVKERRPIVDPNQGQVNVVCAFEQQWRQQGRTPLT